MKNATIVIIFIKNGHNIGDIKVSPFSRFLEKFSQIIFLMEWILLQNADVGFDQLPGLSIWFLPYNRPRKSIPNKVLLQIQFPMLWASLLSMRRTRFIAIYLCDWLTVTHPLLFSEFHLKFMIRIITETSNFFKHLLC